MQQFELKAEPHEDAGKGASRRLRKSGRLPGIVYGATKKAKMVSLVHDDVLHQLEHEAFYSHILSLSVGGKTEKVVLKDLQRHPYKPGLMHIDFQRIKEDEKLTMRVPLHFTNESKSVGVKAGGVVSHIMTELEVSCLPKDLPEFIELDLLAVNVGETVHLGDLKLPDGVAIHALQHGGDPTRPVASIHIPRVAEAEPEAAADAEADAAVAGEAAEGN